MSSINVHYYWCIYIYIYIWRRDIGIGICWYIYRWSYYLLLILEMNLLPFSLVLTSELMVTKSEIDIGGCCNLFLWAEQCYKFITLPQHFSLIGKNKHLCFIQNLSYEMLPNIAENKIIWQRVFPLLLCPTFRNG